MTTTERVPAPKFGRAASISPASYDEAENSVEVIWTTGASVRRRDWRTGNYYNEILDVSPGAVRLERLNGGAPLLDTHQDSECRNVIGTVVPGSAVLRDGKGYARVALSPAPDDASVVGKIRAGIIRNISVGYVIHAVEKTVKDDGSDEDWRVVDWEPHEISAVPIPADAGSHIRGADNDGGSVVVITDPIAAACRARMQALQNALPAIDIVPMGADTMIARARAFGADPERIPDTMARILETALAAVAEAGGDPIEAANLAYGALPRTLDFGANERGAAYGAAFVLAAR
ncbi:hypothetical protein SAMN06297251_12318 [Fulvimarina manganoxydans]|uniref:Phage prohead protease, HK97 family n=1 Tax=Fulvimarina manganoxydans TaxID=937218 RepID=A0A1W2EA07_9HYPH|nr:hypothetical protein [Fulvimarina manganoxydans]SMD06613.1 hypothetical protein SAMN06297251_12318 [Fulvimarina manganoxydans]